MIKKTAVSKSWKMRKHTHISFCVAYRLRNRMNTTAYVHISCWVQVLRSRFTIFMVTQILINPFTIHLFIIHCFYSMSGWSGRWIISFIINNYVLFSRTHHSIYSIKLLISSPMAKNWSPSFRWDGIRSRPKKKRKRKEYRMRV